MLEQTPDLTLALLNEATLAWVEMEYNRSEHSALSRSPLRCFLDDKDVARPCPPGPELQLAFTARAVRTQRRTDGSISVHGRRFEIPSRYGHLARIHIRAASWDLSHVHLCDPATGAVLARLYPQDKRRNADARRRTRDMPSTHTPAPANPQPGAMAPLMRRLIAEYAATGLPPAYMPKDDRPPHTEH